ncbi:50S ribosomal protein L4 [Candidatus Bipolaricaulota bacterium]|nr:50S ribosomal protein L4 [Candidatus Bipolaricaulota bacterium]HBR10519.1 50S ribosomal protein L4 [Candidatus Acetothermia bacterium]
MVEAILHTFTEEEEATKFALSEQIFAAPVNRDLLYRVVRAQLAGRRQGTASTKKRGEVAGGGHKPWRQKGSGRARHGTRRSPLWVGGGITFGPKPRDYTVNLNKKMRRGALAAALSTRITEEKLILIDRIEFDAPKTKAALSLLKRVGKEDSTLVVVGTGEYNKITKKAFANIPSVKCLPSHGLNVYDILRYQGLLLTLSALEEIEERFKNG